MIVVQLHPGGHDLRKMHYVRPVRAGQAGGMRRFKMRIGSVAGDDKGIDHAHALQTSSKMP